MNTSKAAVGILNGANQQFWDQNRESKSIKASTSMGLGQFSNAFCVLQNLNAKIKPSFLQIIYYCQVQKERFLLVSTHKSYSTTHISVTHRNPSTIHETSNQALAGTQRGNDEVMNKLMTIFQPASYQQ